MVLTFDIKAWNVKKANRFGWFSLLMALQKSASVTRNNEVEYVHSSIGQALGSFEFFILLCPLNSCLPNISGPQAYKTFHCLFVFSV